MSYGIAICRVFLSKEPLSGNTYRPLTFFTIRSKDLLAVRSPKLSATY